MDSMVLALKRQEYRESLRSSAGGIVAGLAPLDVEKSAFSAHMRVAGQTFLPTWTCWSSWKLKNPL